MIRSLIQFSKHGQRGVAALDAEGRAFAVNGAETTLQLARQALAAGSIARRIGRAMPWRADRSG